MFPNFHIYVPVSDLIFPGSVHIFPAAEQTDRSWEYVNLSQTNEFGNWDCDRTIPFLEIFVSNFRYWFFSVMMYCKTQYENIQKEFDWFPYTKLVIKSAVPFRKLLEQNVFYPCRFSQDICTVHRLSWKIGMHLVSNFNY